MSDAQEKREAIRKEAERIEEDCTHSGKSHLNSADIWNFVHYGFGIPATICATLAAADVLSETQWGAVLAAAAAVLVALSTFVNPSKKASSHMVAGNQYLSLLKRARRFREIDLPEMAPDEARSALEELSQKRDDLNESSSNPLGISVNKARKGIEDGQSSYRVDETT